MSLERVGGAGPPMGWTLGPPMGWTSGPPMGWTVGPPMGRTLGLREASGHQRWTRGRRRRHSGRVHPDRSAQPPSALEARRRTGPRPRGAGAPEDAALHRPRQAPGRQDRGRASRRPAHKPSQRDYDRENASRDARSWGRTFDWERRNYSTQTGSSDTRIDTPRQWPAHTAHGTGAARTRGSPSLS